MRFVITGAAGFIGSALMHRLQKDGHDVVGVDNFNDYYSPILKRDRIAYRNQNAINIDINDITAEHIAEWAPDIVIHLAARAGVRASLSFPEQYHRDNIDGTQKLIRACEEVSVPKVLYASTSSIMANNKIIPWVESEPVGTILSPYGYTKYVNECQFRLSSIPTTIGMRFFTVYGPWGRPDMALFSFVHNIINRQPIELYNFGKMKRDFTYIDDIVNGIVLLVNDDQQGDHMYNIGNGKQVGLSEFVRSIEINLNLKADIILVPKHPADSRETWSNTTKIQRLGYKPSVDVAQGVANFVQWYQQYYNGDRR